MDENAILDLARQFRERIGYTGDTEQFDQSFIEIVHVVENQCALIVEQTPLELFIVFQPEKLIRLIASLVRGGAPQGEKRA